MYAGDLRMFCGIRLWSAGLSSVFPAKRPMCAHGGLRMFSDVMQCTENRVEKSCIMHVIGNCYTDTAPLLYCVTSYVDDDICGRSTLFAEVTSLFANYNSVRFQLGASNSDPDVRNHLRLVRTDLHSIAESTHLKPSVVANTYQTIRRLDERRMLFS